MKGSGFKVLYHILVVRDDIPRLDSSVAKRIKVTIERKLTAAPDMYGVPLRGTLRKYWKLRVGDWRVVYAIIGSKVRILLIAHRRKIYTLAQTVIKSRD